MLGPRVAGERGIALAPPTLEDLKRLREWSTRPENTYFWGPREGEWTDESLEERFTRGAKDPNSINWTIQLDAKSVGQTGIFRIDWIRRQGESYIIVGESDVRGRGVASEAIRLRTRFAFRELNLHRVYNYVIYDNVGSRRANEKVGYREQGRLPRAFRRGLRRHDDWLGEILKSEWERAQRPDTAT